ncbi:hypothetical protein ALC56_12374, partial [Trachymyrmex septentrionalis]
SRERCGVGDRAPVGAAYCSERRHSEREEENRRVIARYTWREEKEKKRERERERKRKRRTT